MGAGGSNPRVQARRKGGKTGGGLSLTLSRFGRGCAARGRAKGAKSATARAEKEGHSVQSSAPEDHGKRLGNPKVSAKII